MDHSSARVKTPPRLPQIEALIRATSAFTAGYAQALDLFPRRSFSYQPARDSVAALLTDQQTLAHDCAKVMGKINQNR